MKKSRIMSIRSVGKQPTLNVTMRGQQHNYAITSSCGISIYSQNSHAVGYARKSYLTAYLKSHFPQAFMAARLSVEIREHSDDKKLQSYKNDTVRMGFRFLPIDINKSKVDYDVVDSKYIRESILTKGIGEKLAEEIVRHQPYEGPDVLYSFIKKLDHVDILNSKVIEAMYLSGLWKDQGTMTQVVEKFKTIKKDLKVRKSRQHNNIMFSPKKV